MAGVFIASLRTLGDQDIWFQLLAGRYVLDRGMVPHHDFFLYVGQHNPQMFGGWGFGVIYELVIRAVGLPGATILNAGVWCGAFYLSARAALLRGNLHVRDLQTDQLISFSLVMTVLFIGIESRLALRAESTLFFAWALLAYLFEKWRCQANIVKFWFALPIIVCAEAWLHTGAFMLIPFGVICAVRSVSDSTNRGWTFIFGWLISLCALCLLPIANPNGVDQVYTQLIHIVQSLGDAATVKANSFNLEYLPIWDAREMPQWFRFIFVGLLLLVVALKKRRWADWTEIMVCVAFFAMACLHNRGISLAVMSLMVPAMHWCLVRSRDIFNIPNVVKIMLCSVLAFLPIVQSSGNPLFGVQSSELGLEKTAALIRASKPNGAKVFTRENGPMLAYALGNESYLVSRGGHSLITNNEADSHFFNTIGGTEIWEAELTKYKVDFVCVDFYLPLPGDGIFYWLPSFLVTNPSWKMLPLQDGSCNLFEKLPAGQMLTEKEIDDQLESYLRFLSFFADYEYFGVSDVTGQAIGRKAKIQLDLLMKRRSN